ncbi:hypothetical protein LB579_30335, partial [Mesorhizobium sp. BR1-1-7]|uniref:hypothetical protein n=1 Tax=Mesorhizobium sp. BR1-1-7 TaxID=2876647 RepID=UPI001CCA8F0E
RQGAGDSTATDAGADRRVCRRGRRCCLCILDHRLCPWQAELIGWFAWPAWALIRVYLLVGFQHRVQVSIQWLWRYLNL